MMRSRNRTETKFVGQCRECGRDIEHYRRALQPQLAGSDGVHVRVECCETIAYLKKDDEQDSAEGPWWFIPPELAEQCHHFRSGVQSL